MEDSEEEEEEDTYRMGNDVSNWPTVILSVGHPPPGWCTGNSGGSGGGDRICGRKGGDFDDVRGGGLMGRVKFRDWRDSSGDSDWYGAKSMFVVVCLDIGRW